MSEAMQTAVVRGPRPRKGGCGPALSRWQPHEEAVIRDLYGRNADMSEFQELLPGRTVQAIDAKILRMITVGDLERREKPKREPKARAPEHGPNREPLRYTPPGILPPLACLGGASGLPEKPVDETVTAEGKHLCQRRVVRDGAWVVCRTVTVGARPYCESCRAEIAQRRRA